LIIKPEGYFCPGWQRHKKLKKTIAIFFLLGQVFHLGGYLLLHWYAVNCSDDFFNAQIAKGRYYKADLVEVAIPVSIPCIHDWKNFEPVFGCVHFGENAYNYVQMKVTGNMLYLKCVPNYETTKLCTQNVIQAEAIKDIPVPKTDHVPYPHVLSVRAFKVDIQRFAAYIHSTEMAKPIIDYRPPLIERHPDIPKQPPKYAC
jgi:hypothetical protein